MASCNKTQQSKEALIKIDDSYKVFGIFTYYLCKIINYKKIYDLNNLDYISKNDIWFIIEKKFSQKFIYKKFFLTISNE